LSDTKECLTNSNCGENYKLYIDYDNSIFLCYKQTGATTQCPDDFPYKYGNLCLRKCSDTQKSLYSGFVIKTTYTHITSSEKKCVISCNESDNTNKYYDEETLECINDCTTTSKKYKFGNKCVKSCDTTANKFHNYGQYDCINECDYSSSFKYKSNEDKICYDDCKKLSPIFYYDKDKKLCFSKCDKYILKKKEGSNEILYCLDQCSDGNSLSGEPSSTNLVHRYNDKICLESCKVNDNDNSPYYHININQVCYQSCKDVNNNNKYEYNSLCHTTIGDFGGKLHYTMASSIIKFIGPSENETDFCSQAGLYYTKDDDSSISGGGKKCTNCVSTDYKIPYTLDANGKINRLGQCFTSKNDCKDAGYPYYNENDKICHQNCNYRQLYNIDDNSLPNNCLAWLITVLLLEPLKLPLIPVANASINPCNTY
jgi:hypothetical protein